MRKSQFVELALLFEDYVGKEVEFKTYVPGKGIYRKEKGSIVGLGVFDNCIVRVRLADNRYVAVPYSNVHIPVNH